MAENPKSAARKTWREKLPSEMRKGDFVYAVAACPEYRREPLIMAVAHALADHWNPQHKITWVSIGRLAFLTNSLQGKVSTRIQRMVKDGALIEVARDKVHEEVLALCGSKDKRGKFFNLNFMWAYEVAERLNNPAFTRGSEPSQLVKGKRRRPKQGYCDSNISNNVTMTVSRNVPVTVTHIGDCDSKTKLKCSTGEELKRAGREKEERLRAHTHEGEPSDNPYALAKEGIGKIPSFSVPSDDAQAIALIEELRAGRPVTPEVMRYWRLKAADRQLTAEIVEAYYGRLA